MPLKNSASVGGLYFLQGRGQTNTDFVIVVIVMIIIIIIIINDFVIVIIIFMIVIESFSKWNRLLNEDGMLRQVDFHLFTPPPPK